MPAPPTLLDLRTHATPLGGGRHSEVFALEGRIYKVYKERGISALEQANMRRAGLGSWIAGTLELEGREVLVQRQFDGSPARADTLPGALEQVRTFLTRLHRDHPESARVDVTALAARLERFQVLEGPELLPLFTAVHEALERGLFEGQAAFCHLDLWADNVLISGAGEVLVIDWARAGPDDPLRDLALFKTGTLDLLGANDSLAALEPYLHTALERRKLRAYLALTTLHDLYWLSRNEPEKLPRDGPFKLERALDALEVL